uniref:Uncharacterized protein n=1 Tax=Vespula pensylvanica TaxID=30213 RepID=A0A834KQI4_VESPE|nr:hypothetical protein H0235_013347 [Vespula pensylvanica]
MISSVSGSRVQSAVGLRGGRYGPGAATAASEASPFFLRAFLLALPSPSAAAAATAPPPPPPPPLLLLILVPVPASQQQHRRCCRRPRDSTEPIRRRPSLASLTTHPLSSQPTAVTPQPASPAAPASQTATTSKLSVSTRQPTRPTPLHSPPSSPTFPSANPFWLSSTPPNRTTPVLIKEREATERSEFQASPSPPTTPTALPHTVLPLFPTLFDHHQKLPTASDRQSDS